MNAEPITPLHTLVTRAEFNAWLRSRVLPVRLLGVTQLEPQVWMPDDPAVTSEMMAALRELAKRRGVSVEVPRRTETVSLHDALTSHERYRFETAGAWPARLPFAWVMRASERVGVFRALPHLQARERTALLYAWFVEQPNTVQEPEAERLTVPPTSASESLSPASNTHVEATTSVDHPSVPAAVACVVTHESVDGGRATVTGLPDPSMFRPWFHRVRVSRRRWKRYRMPGVASKVSDAEADAIRIWRQRKGMSISALARQFSRTRETVGRVLRTG